MPKTPPDLFLGLGLNVGWRRKEQETRVSLPKADCGVDAYHDPYVGAETPPEIPRPGVGGTKLVLQGFPWNQAGPAKVTHPVSEPDVSVDRQWRALQEFDGPEIDRYGGAGDFLEELAAEDELWIPGWPSPLEARLEELKSGIAGRDQAATALLGPEVLGVLPVESGGKEAVKLVVESLGGASWSADGRKTKLASQLVGCLPKIDLGALRANSLGRQIDEDEAGIETVGKTDRAPRIELQGIAPIDPLRPISRRPAVGKGREDQDARHEAEGACFVNTCVSPKPHPPNEIVDTLQ